MSDHGLFAFLVIPRRGSAYGLAIPNGCHEAIAMNAVPYLQRYLADSNWLALVQMLIFAGIIYLLLARTVGVFRDGAGGSVANSLIEHLTQLCMGLGLLLTFSGLYSYMAAGSSGDQGPLLMALGSSAIGYSGWTVCAAASVIDGLLAAYQQQPPIAAEVPTRLPLRVPSNEQELDDDLDCRSRHLGGIADYTDQEDDAALGSLAGHQRRESDSQPERDDPDSDLDDQEWGYRLLAGEEPDTDDRPSEPTPPATRRPRPQPPLGGPTLV
ncbi:MAG: hypothetical protein ABI614_20465 [Planctomycetota bacterium]